ncbi:MAG: hypothetical protein ABIN97_03990 [Ginsengibacter sp.]
MIFFYKINKPILWILIVCISILQTNVVAQNITHAEWYVDTDPGYGNAQSISLANLPNLSLTYNRLDTLSQGLHIIGIRSKNANGAWSFDEHWLILKQAISAQSVNIIKAEWYLDKDPGYGKAINIPLTPGKDLVNLTFNSNNLDTLVSGLHVIAVRSLDANGAWSFDERWLISEQKPAVSVPNLVRIEYYIDADPGWGKGMPLALLPGKDSITVPAFINITGLTAGLHKLFIRSQDSNKVWSFDDTVHFTIDSPRASPFINVNSVAFTNACTAGSFTLGYHATGSYNPGNQFIVEISNQQGSFMNAGSIGSINSFENSGLINCNMPANKQQTGGYKMRVRSTNPVVTDEQSLSLFVGNFFLGNDTFKVITCSEEKLDLTHIYNPSNSTLIWTIANPSAASVGIHNVFATNAFGCKDTALITISLPTATWTGAVSSNWHTPANWSTGAIPTDTTHVIIPTGTPNECEISAGDAMAASVNVKGAATKLRIFSGRKLLIRSNCASVPQ